MAMPVQAPILCKVRMSQYPVVYEIQVEGLLAEYWSDWFADVNLTYIEAGGGITVMTGVMQDQAALYGLLAKVRDLGLVLIAVRRING